jgi:hypothetical protein
MIGDPREGFGICARVLTRSQQVCRPRGKIKNAPYSAQPAFDAPGFADLEFMELYTQICSEFPCSEDRFWRERGRLNSSIQLHSLLRLGQSAIDVYGDLTSFRNG